MIQRYLYTALKEGIDAILKNPVILDDLFRELYGLEVKEVAAIKTVFAAHPPEVIHGYARHDSKFPLFSIVLANEGESQTVLADQAGFVADEDDPDYGTDIESAVWQHTYQVLIYSEHPDVTGYYYEIAKSILIAANDYFVQQGIFNQKYSGMDLAPDPRYVPERLFLRQLTMTCEREFMRLSRDVKKAFKVSGIYVDKSGSDSDVGGVQTGVVPVTQ